jgi:hypothetical protein
LTVQHPLNVTASFNLNGYSVMINAAKKNRAARERAGMKPVSKHIASRPAGTSVVTAREQLWHLAYREASTLAFLVATLLVPLMRKARPRSPLPLLRPTNGSDADT